jgi:hypothetical protein
MPTSSPDQTGCYAVAAILLVFSTAAVSGRLFVRRMKRAPIGFDDISILLSLVSSTSIAVVPECLPDHRLIIQPYSCLFGHSPSLSSMVEKDTFTTCEILT